MEMVKINEEHFSPSSWDSYLNKKKNQTWKLLPLKEEGNYWEKQAKTLILEFRGLHKMISNEVEYEVLLLSILERLNGLFEEKDFMIYRKTVFEVISLIEGLQNNGKK